MSKKMRRIFAAMLCLVLILSQVACGKKDGSPKTVGTIGEVENKYGTTYPLNTGDAVLSLWCILGVHTDYVSYEDMPFYQAIQKETGVDLDISGPASGAYDEAFNLLVASGDLPDLIMYDWGNEKIVGGPEKYISDGYIVPLNDIFSAYAPNLTKILKENPDVDRQIKTDGGNYYVFPYMNLKDSHAWQGPVIREDWLNELNIPVPETIDDWYNMLTKFKDAKNVTPLLYLDWNFSQTGFISGAYGELRNFYVEDGKIKHGAYSEGWKDFLTTINKWYKEGLLDQDIATLDSSMKQSRVISGKTGAFLGSGGDIESFKPMIEKVDPKAKFVGVSYPVLNKGDKPKFGQADNKYTGLMSTAITADCDDVELAAKFMDWFFTDAGRLRSQWGTEGVTYNLKDGKPVLTDEVLNSGKVNSILREHAIEYYGISDPDQYLQRMIYPEQINALEVWNETDMKEHLLPVLLPNEEEAAEINSLMNNIKSYIDEMYIKYMLGTESLESYDTYMSHLKELGIERVLEIYQGVYDRYQAR